MQVSVKSGKRAAKFTKREIACLREAMQFCEQLADIFDSDDASQAASDLSALLAGVSEDGSYKPVSDVVRDATDAK